MNTVKTAKTLILTCVASLSLAACAAAPMESTTRNSSASLPTKAMMSAPATAPMRTSFNFTSVRVNVPRSLQVSEANRYYPGGDIVWREDPLGDRHAQVQIIVEAGMKKGLQGLSQGQVPAMVDIQVTRFHALTEKARYTTGGVHALQFMLVLRDPETGKAFGEPKFIKADFKAYGGSKAIAAERQGLTQKVRITNHLADVIRQELTSPEGYVAENTGFYGALNQL